MDSHMATVSCSRALKEETRKHTLLLSFQCLGVIFGQISTVPLYLLASIDKENIDSEEEVYEHFSFIFWTLSLVCLLKYALIVLDADNDGEGGIFALYSLLCHHAKVGLLPSERSESEVMSCSSETPKMKAASRARRAIEKHKSFHYIMLVFALIGCCMTISDGVLTPAISAMSAASGVQSSLSDLSKIFPGSPDSHLRITNIIKRYVGIPIACVIVVCLFMFQHFGTHKIGIVFAPIIAVWLLLISGLGIYNIVFYNRDIMYAIFPEYLFRFLKKANYHQWRSLGSVILCSAGAEAMFSNLGHFSKKSIKLTFICFVYPLLILSYAGQSAFMSKKYHLDDFNHLLQSVPKGAAQHLYVVCALFASAVGSQAAITASFSIINQCLALGCFPRVKVIHTSDKIHGQIYIPDVNWILMLFSLTVVVSFRDIIKLGSATGLAIVSGMVVTTCLATVVIATWWEKVPQAACFLTLFGLLETFYVACSLLNFHRGAWFLFALLALSFTVMIAWHYGTKKKYEYDLENKVSTEWLTNLSPGLGVARVAGIGFIHTDVVSGIPAFFSHFITNCPAYHQVLILVSFKPLPVPYLLSSQHYLIGRIGPKDFRIYRCIVRYGYRDHVSTNDVEEQIIRSIGEFISKEENESEAVTSNEASRMVVVGTPPGEGSALVSSNPDANTVDEIVGFSENEYSMEEGPFAPARRKKKVRFVLPPESRALEVHVREELEELTEAMESGTAHFLGKSRFKVRGDNSNIMKKLLIMAYVFLETNCRETSVALNIPRAAVLEVGVVYPI